LAARLGRRRAPWLYVTCAVLCVSAIVIGGEGVAGAFALALYINPVRMSFSSRNGRELLPLLAMSAKSQLLIGAALVVSFWVTR
jgi:1,4-dihydroxy-2-naphthoate octaprenyltransferase